MKTYSVALVGCGKIGARERFSAAITPGTHLGAYAQQPRTEIVALVDPSEEDLAAARARAPQAGCFRSLDEMFAAVTPDIVSVATPSRLHVEHVLAAASRGPKAIVCEKPIAMTVEDGRRMIAACRENGVLLLVNHMRRFDPGIRETKRRLADYGPILQAQAAYIWGIYNSGTHVIDLLRFFLGEIVEVSGFRNELTANFKDIEGDCNIDGFLTFANGAHASLQSLDFNDYNIFNLNLYGRKGRVTVTHFGFETVYAGLTDCEAFTGHKEIDEWRVERVGAPRSLFAPMADHVVACLDGRESPLSTGEDALEALKVIQALVMSANDGGRPVKL